MYDYVTFADTAKVVVLAAGSVVVTHLLINMLVEKDAAERKRLCQRQIRRRLRNARRLGRRHRGGRRQRRRPPTTPEAEELAWRDGGGEEEGRVALDADPPAPDAPAASADNHHHEDMARLRDELQAWMQAEQSGGGAHETERIARNPAGVDRSHEGCPVSEDAPTGSDSEQAGGRATTLEWVNGRAQARVASDGITARDATGEDVRARQEATGPGPIADASLLAPVDETLGCASPKKGEDERYQNMMNGGDIGNGLHAWDSMQASYASI